MNLDDLIQEMEKEQRISIVRYCGFRGSAKAVFGWLNMLARIKPLKTPQWHQDYLEKAWAELAYAIAKRIDDSLIALFLGFKQSVGTDGAALADDILLFVKEHPDLAQASFEGRTLLIDPKSMTDLHKN